MRFRGYSCYSIFREQVHAKSGESMCSSITGYQTHGSGNETLTTSFLRLREHPPCPSEGGSSFFPLLGYRTQMNRAIRNPPRQFCWRFEGWFDITTSGLLVRERFRTCQLIEDCQCTYNRIVGRIFDTLGRSDHESSRKSRKRYTPTVFSHPLGLVPLP